MLPTTAPITAPCGYVEFKPWSAPRFVNGTAHESIAMTVHFRDGHTESEKIPYDWVYPDGERTDPWSHTNLQRGDFAVPFQFPPPGFERSKLPPLVAFVVDHTSIGGFTDLPVCPSGTSATSGATLQDLQSHVALVPQPESRLAVIAYSQRTSKPGSSAVVSACVAFANLAEKAVRSIRFGLRYLNPAGAQVGSATIEATGLFRTGEGSPSMVVRGGPPSSKYCRTVFDAALLPPAATRVANVLVRVDEVDYEDGTTWRAANPADRVH
jgi:hypothetical protein